MILIYAVYKHDEKYASGQFIKAVKSYTEALEFEEQLKQDPNKADNISRLIFRSTPSIREKI